MKKIVSAALAAWAAALLGAAGLEVRVQDRELELHLEGVILQISLSGPTLPGGMTIKGETGADGSAVLEIPDEFARGVLGAQFPGYETARLPVRPGASEILVEMNISGVIDRVTVVPSEDNQPATVKVHIGDHTVSLKNLREITPAAAAT